MTSRSLTLTQSDLILTDFDGRFTLIDTGIAMINALSEQAQGQA